MGLSIHLGSWYSCMDTKSFILTAKQRNLDNFLSKCSFERIYFSRGSDVDIYKERQQLGRNIVPQILEKIDNDLANSVFSFIPNTAEVSFYGMVKGLEDHLNEEKIKSIILYCVILRTIFCLITFSICFVCY